MAQRGSSQKVANSLVAMSSAAVLAVYAAGYVRTRPAADRLAQQTLARTISRQIVPGDIPPPFSSPAQIASGELAAPAAAISPESRHVNPPPKAMPAPKTDANPAAPAVLVNVPITAAAPIPDSTLLVNSAVPVAPPVSAAPVIPPAIVAPALPATAPSTASSNLSSVVPPVPAPKTWKDGKYVAWGGSPHGDIQATVVIESGRIVSAEITDCQTRYPCDLIAKLPPQVLKRQSPNVDRISGATESADAFYSAVYFALGQAH